MKDVVTAEQRPAYNNKNRVLQDLLVKMYNPTNKTPPSSGKMFAVPEDPNEGIMALSLAMSKREWSVCEIAIRRTISPNGDTMLSCDFNRISGCRVSATYLIQALRSNNYLFNLPMNDSIAETRTELLKFTEGVSPTNTHIQRYVCNDLLIREICSFIPYRKFIY
jgi:hypothetical protein